ncbi:MAG: VOC family protein [Fibrobacteres bacterium]|jgi:PhnB protein|nr:VOC family protein [Fibrobacterota bacterium]
MKSLTPHLNFQPGKTREALGFYKQALRGEIESIQTYSDAKLDVPPPLRDEVVHAVFKAGAVRFTASSGNPQNPVKAGTNTKLLLEFGDGKEQDAVWKGLSEGGEIGMPLQDTFWGARFGMLTDKYGINWMLNCPKQQP